MLVYGQVSGIGQQGMDAIRDTLYNKAVEAGWLAHDPANRVVKMDGAEVYVWFAPVAVDDDYFYYGALTKTDATANLKRAHIPVVASTAWDDVNGAPAGVGQGFYLCTAISTSGVPSYAYFAQYAFDVDAMAFLLWGDMANSWALRSFFALFTIEQYPPYPASSHVHWALGTTGNSAGNSGQFPVVRNIDNPSAWGTLFARSLPYSADIQKYLIDDEPLIVGMYKVPNFRVYGKLNASGRKVFKVLSIPRRHSWADTIGYINPPYYGNYDAFSDLFEVQVSNERYLAGRITLDGYTISDRQFASYAPLIAVRSG